MDLMNGWMALGIVLVFLLAALMVRQYAPRERRRLRSLTLFVAAYLVAFGATLLARAQDWTGVAQTAQDMAALFGWIALIFISSLAIFRLTLPRFGVKLPSIIGDLYVGGSFLVLIFAGLRNLGVDPTSIVATSAVVTGILALSLQPTLGNIIGGVALQLDRSIGVDDWVQLENGRQGRVREIRWRHTVIETRDWDTMIVPNSALLAATIMILGKRVDEPVQHRMWVYFNIDFRHRPTHVIETAESALQADPWIEGVARHPLPNCVCLDLARDGRESYGLYAVRYWLTDLAHDDPTSSRVRQRLYAALRRARIPLAIPAAQFFIEQDDEQHRNMKLARNIKERRLALDTVEFLNVLTVEEQKEVAANLSAEPFADGETIMREGDEADWLAILSEGQVEVCIARDGKRQVVATLEAPTVFGEMGLMTGEPRRATVTACGAVLCYKLHHRVFGQILERRPEIAKDVSAILADRDVELQIARENLDARSSKRRKTEVSSQILAGIQQFFGLGD